MNLTAALREVVHLHQPCLTMIDHVGNIGAIKHLTFCNAVVDLNWLSCLYAVYIFKVIYILDCKLYLC